MIKRILFFYVLICLGTGVDAQRSKIFFSEALQAELPRYIAQAEAILSTDRPQDIKLLFNQLVEGSLLGTYMDNFAARKISKRDITLSDFEKPIIFLTYTSWNLNSKGEIAALNDMAKQYSDQIDFVVLFWDKHKVAKKHAKDFHGDVHVLYVDELDNTYTHTVRTLKHALGLPLLFTINSEKRIVNLERRLHHKLSLSEEASYNTNLERFKADVTQLLFAEQQIGDIPVVAQD